MVELIMLMQILACALVRLALMVNLASINTLLLATFHCIYIPNLAPIHSKSSRQLIAVVAVGKERIQSLELYSSLHEQSLQESLDSSAVNPDDPDINETVISDPGPDESGTSNANPDESGMKDTGE